MEDIEISIRNKKNMNRNIDKNIFCVNINKQRKLYCILYLLYSRTISQKGSYTPVKPGLTTPSIVATVRYFCYNNKPYKRGLNFDL